MIQIKNVLVAMDFSEQSDAALRCGRELARTFNARLQVLNVVDNVYLRFGVEPYVPAIPELQRDIEEAARQRIESLLDAEDRDALRATPVIVSAVSAAEAIVTYAGAHAIDVIVMGTHGRGAIGHLLMGSVAERVVRTATCPVLTVHSAQHEFIVPDSLAAVARAS
jgi:universal stress protein A